MPDGTSKDWDAFNRKKKLSRPIQQSGPRPDEIERAIERDHAYETGRRHGRAEGFFEGAQEAIDLTKETSVVDRVRGGAHLEGKIKDKMREKIGQRRRQLPPPERRG